MRGYLEETKIPKLDTTQFYVYQMEKLLKEAKTPEERREQIARFFAENVTLR